MVGIPGKSTGCHTCRKRKIRCDSKKPLCQRCITTGRQCEGYERFPIFVNRTVRGLERRERLEEVRMSADASPPSGKSDLSTIPVISFGQITHLPQRSNVLLFEDSCIRTFISDYLPSVGQLARGVWLRQVFDLQDRKPALQSALLAVVLTRAGRITNTPSIYVAGRDAYGSALREMQKSLFDPDLMWDDQTLAAGQMLRLYELAESTSGSVSGFRQHEEGTVRLLRLRGPQRHQTPLARAIVDSARNTEFHRCSTMRQRSFLNEPAWRLVPFEGDFGLLERRRSDIGLDLCAIFEDIDQIDISAMDTDTWAAVYSCCVRFAKIDQALDLWYTDFSNTMPTPFYWEDDLDPNATSPDLPRPFRYPSPQIAYETAIYNSMCIIASLAVAGFTSRILSLHKLDNDDIINVLSRRHTPAQRVERARTITRTMPFCLQSGMGLLSATTMLFPMRVANAVFYADSKNHKELAWCRGMYLKITRMKGINFAETIGTDFGKWAKDVVELAPGKRVKE